MDDAGTAATYVRLIGLLEPFEDRPRARKVLETASVTVVALQFAAGQELHEHAAHHPVIIQTVAGHTRLTYDQHQVDLFPGDLVHLDAMKRHSVVAVEHSTLTVTMLIGPTGRTRETSPRPTDAA